MWEQKDILELARDWVSVDIKLHDLRVQADLHSAIFRDMNPKERIKLRDAVLNEQARQRK